jgi:hypothetical protein
MGRTTWREKAAVLALATALAIAGLWVMEAARKAAQDALEAEQGTALFLSGY